MKFGTAVEGTDEIAPYLRDQLNALEKSHQNRVHAQRPKRITGSVDLDSALQPGHPNAHRWDYVVGYRINNQEDRAYFIEVHRAEVGEVSRVVRKKQWLQCWLQGKAMDDMRPREFVWLSAGAIRILRNSPAWRALNMNGLKLVRTLQLGWKPMPIRMSCWPSVAGWLHEGAIALLVARGQREIDLDHVKCTGLVGQRPKPRNRSVHQALGCCSDVNDRRQNGCLSQSSIRETTHGRIR